VIYLLDTNTCIQYLNGRSDSIRRKFEHHLWENLAVCSIVRAELIFGALKSGRSLANLDRMRTFLAGLVCFPFDDPAADVYGQIRADLEQKGTSIGPNDLLIAAIAFARGITLVTHNVKEFKRVEGLHFEDWE
jgi:tRNA(fMet)-specific endonuclease VapC